MVSKIKFNSKHFIKKNNNNHLKRNRYKPQYRIQVIMRPFILKRKNCHLRMSPLLMLKTIVDLFRAAGVCCCCFLSSASSLFFVFRFHNNGISTQWPIVYLISPTVFLFVFLCFTVFCVAIVNDECWLFVIRLSPPPGLGWRVSSGDTEGLTWQNLISGAVVSALNHPISSSNSLACDGQTLCLGWRGVPMRACV